MCPLQRFMPRLAMEQNHINFQHTPAILAFAGLHGLQLRKYLHETTCSRYHGLYSARTHASTQGKCSRTHRGDSRKQGSSLQSDNTWENFCQGHQAFKASAPTWVLRVYSLLGVTLQLSDSQARCPYKLYSHVN